MLTRRGVRQVLGGLWLLDGVLQLQPFMSRGGFASQVLQPAGVGQPGWVSAGVNWAAGLVGSQPALWNMLFAAGQIALGIGLFVAPLVRYALGASIVWVAAVWYFGEGLGGLASGHATLLTGAPGAVLLYAVLAVLAWPVLDAAGEEIAAPPPWTPAAWAGLWVGGAVLQALPGQNTADGLAGAFGSAGPNWLMPVDDGLRAGITRLGGTSVWLFVAVLLAIGLGGLGGRGMRTVAGWAGLVAGVLFWVFGEGFGGLTSGRATDPGTGPLLALFAVALLSTRPAPEPVAEIDDEDEDEDEEPAVPRATWRIPVLSGTSAMAVVGVGLLLWFTTQPAAVAEPRSQISVAGVYTPAGDGPTAPVYFTIINSGNAPDTLVGAGADYQTARMITSATVCSDETCGAHTVTIPAHSTMVFGPGGPHLVVAGLGPLKVGQHQPLQMTLQFEKSTTVHVLSPIGSPNTLTERDVMMWAYMGGKDPGMGGMGVPMDGSAPKTTMPEMGGMDMSGGH